MKNDPFDDPASKPAVAKSKQKAIINALREVGTKGLTRIELMRLTGLDRQAIDRSVVLINLQGGKIVKEAAPAGSGSRQLLVLRKEPTWFCAISLHARLALHIAEAALPQIGSESLAQFLELFGKLEDSKLSPKDQHRLETLLKMVQVGGTVDPAKKASPSMLAPILESLCAHPGPPEVQIEYQGGIGQGSKPRTIIPHALTYDSFAGSSYLLALASTSHGKQPLLFRLSRITKWETTRRAGFLKPEERQALDRAKKYQIGGWFEDTEPFEITMRISGKKWISAFLESQPGLPDFQMEKGRGSGEPHQIIRFKATEMQGPMRWLAQLGADAEVLSPPEFRSHVASVLEEAARVYRTGSRK